VLGSKAFVETFFERKRARIGPKRESPGFHSLG